MSWKTSHEQSEALAATAEVFARDRNTIEATRHYLFAASHELAAAPSLTSDSQPSFKARTFGITISSAAWLFLKAERKAMAAIVIAIAREGLKDFSVFKYTEQELAELDRLCCNEGL